MPQKHDLGWQKKNKRPRSAHPAEKSQKKKELHAEKIRKREVRLNTLFWQGEAKRRKEPWKGVP